LKLIKYTFTHICIERYLCTGISVNTLARNFLCIRKNSDDSLMCVYQKQSFKTSKGSYHNFENASSSRFSFSGNSPDFVRFPLLLIFDLPIPLFHSSPSCSHNSLRSLLLSLGPLGNLMQSAQAGGRQPAYVVAMRVADSQLSGALYWRGLCNDVVPGRKSSAYASPTFLKVIFSYYSP